MTATRKAATLVALAAGWALAAWYLTRTSIPSLHEPHVDARAEFSGAVLRRATRYDAFLRWEWVVATVVTLAVLLLFTWLGPRIARAWELGRVGTGVMVGALTTLGTWAAGLPFGVVALWWGRRYGLEKQSYVSWALQQWPGLLAQVVGLTIALTILLLLAGRFGPRWWVVAAPLFVALGAVLVVALPYLETVGTRAPHRTRVAARIAWSASPGTSRRGGRPSASGRRWPGARSSAPSARWRAASPTTSTRRWPSSRATRSWRARPSGRATPGRPAGTSRPSRGRRPRAPRRWSGCWPSRGSESRARAGP